jgi:hypothetical protein
MSAYHISGALSEEAMTGRWADITARAITAINWQSGFR